MDYLYFVCGLLFYLKFTDTSKQLTKDQIKHKENINNLMEYMLYDFFNLR